VTRRHETGYHTRSDIVLISRCLMSFRECISLFLWCHFSMFSMSQCLILDLSVSNIGSGMITCLMSFHHCISLFLWCHCSMFSMSQCLISDLKWHHKNTNTVMKRHQTCYHTRSDIRHCDILNIEKWHHKNRLIQWWKDIRQDLVW
jgi:hypothetical protein